MFHVGCLGQFTGYRAQGPWHCEQCTERFTREGLRDVTLDECAVDYVVTGAHREEWPPSVRRRVERVAQFLHWDSELQRLWIGPADVRERWREIPPIS